MTALNLLLGSRRAYVLTDTIVYDRKGTTIGKALKCVVAPDARIAVASRGDSRLPAAAAAIINRTMEDIDERLDTEAELLAFHYDRSVETLGAIDVRAEIAFAGFSRRQGRPVAASLVRSDQGWAFALIGEEGLAAPVPDDARLDELESIGVDFGETDADTFDPLRHGVPLMEAQRRMRFSVNGVPPGHYVGGEVILTTISAAGIDQRPIHAWPDEIGRPIRPEAFVRPQVVALNRAERRRLAKAGQAA